MEENKDEVKDLQSNVDEVTVVPEPVVEINKVEEEVVTQVEETPVFEEKIVVNNDEIIGKIVKEKEGSPILILVLFGLMSAFLFFLPTITDFVNEVFREEIPVITPDDPDEPKLPDKSDVEEALMAPFNNATVYKMEGVTFSDFSFTEDYYLKFNLGLNIPDINVDNIFIELYDDNNTMLMRRILVSNQAIDNKVIANANVATNATQIKIVRKDKNTYPAFSFTEDDTIRCNNGIVNMAYYFKEDKLVSFDESKVVNNTETNYIEMFNTDTNRVTELNKIEGVASSIVSSDTSYNMLSKFDLSKVDFTNLKNERYYELDNLPKVVSFEMKAKGYVCK